MDDCIVETGSYKERMLQEYEELKERYLKLDKFIEDQRSGNVDRISDSELRLLETQRGHMFGYKMALLIRLVKAGVKKLTDLETEL